MSPHKLTKHISFWKIFCFILPECTFEALVRNFLEHLVIYNSKPSKLHVSFYSLHNFDFVHVVLYADRNTTIYYMGWQLYCRVLNWIKQIKSIDDVNNYSEFKLNNYLYEIVQLIMSDDWKNWYTKKLLPNKKMEKT